MNLPSQKTMISQTEFGYKIFNYENKSRGNRTKREDNTINGEAKEEREEVTPIEDNGQVSLIRSQEEV